MFFTVGPERGYIRWVGSLFFSLSSGVTPALAPADAAEPDAAEPDAAVPGVVDGVASFPMKES